jgi:hypothetical protein
MALLVVWGKPVSNELSIYFSRSNFHQCSSMCLALAAPSLMRQVCRPYTRPYFLGQLYAPFAPC